MKVYNVWVEVEAIDEENDINGEDIMTEKVAKFKTEAKAIEYAQELAAHYQTLRDEEGFTND